MSTLNCPEEVYLAEKLIELHPWADMARFARSGGEANAIAIRIARAASGKDKVAICGYHGWHDWYLAANLGDGEHLAGHLLPGLEPNGVPQNLRGSVYPFTYNRFDELEALVAQHDIGVIKMEVSRNSGPTDNFLQKVRQLATDRGIVLIFDECTSGFRQTFGGLHKLYGVEPDMAMFGKAIGNGYAITGDDRAPRSHGGGADDFHLEHLLDRAHRAVGRAQDARSDGAHQILGDDHRHREQNPTRLDGACRQAWSADRSLGSAVALRLHLQKRSGAGL